MSRVFACFVVFLVGCSSQPKINHEAAVKTSLQSYSDCMFDAGERYITSSSSAYEIADAAQGRCDGQFMTYRKAIESYFRSAFPRRYGPEAARSEGAQRANETKARMQRLVIQTVVDARAVK